MAQLNFNAQQFESQRLPDQLPEPAAPQTADGIVLTAEQQTYLGTVSAFPGMDLLDTPEKVLQHCELQAQLRAAQAAQVVQVVQESKTDPLERARVKASRIEHSTVVNNANIAWREAVEYRKQELVKLDAMVKAKHDEFKRLRDMKV